uniref:Uncharacterized protein n=1 Tax=Anguilla anguilla TaxID=7936 RepID=A0A0E9TES7_ANGAN
MRRLHITAICTLCSRHSDINPRSRLDL